MIGKYARAFSFLVEQPKWVCRGDGDVYANYQWCDERPQPTEAECDDALPAILLDEERRQVAANRQAAYAAESDPLFFRWQRGEATEADWLAKVAEIRNRYPEP